MAFVSDGHCAHSHSRVESSQLRQCDDALGDGLQVSRFTKADLRGAEVLGQVDRKFIVCVIANKPQRANDEGEGELLDEAAGAGAFPEKSLVLIDQHAADERVRVERLMAELCLDMPDHTTEAQDQTLPTSYTGSRRRVLEPPVLVLLTSPEVDTLSRNTDIKNAFSRWGIEFASFGESKPERHDESAMDFLSTKLRAKDDAMDHGYAQVAVKTVPEVVADKVRSHTVVSIGDAVTEWFGRIVARRRSSSRPDQELSP